MHLNESQQRAVTSEAAQIVMPAGPGSGKSRVLTERIKHRIRLGADPAGIYVLTFTTAGAAVFRERLHGIHLGFLGTLHSFCLGLLQKHGASIGYRPGAVSIVPPEATRSMLLEIAGRTKSKLSAEKLMGEKPAKTSEAAELARIVGEYQRQLKAASMVDYDGILREGLRLIRGGVDLGIRELYVDECQDSGAEDWDIYRAIGAQFSFFTGDPDQAIFSFRGAAPELFTKAAILANNFCGGELITLERNYRSDVAICDAATRLIRHNTGRVEKDVVPESTKDGGILVVELQSCAAEIRSVVEFIIYRGYQNLAGSVAILARDNHTANRFREALRLAGVRVAGAEEARMPGDWHKALLLASMLNDPNDIVVEAWLRLDKGRDVNRIKLEAQRDGIPLVTAAKDVAMWAEVINLKTPHGALHAMYSQGISAESCELIESRIALLPQEAPTLGDLLADLHGSRNWTAQGKEQEGVVCSTVHAAKGREFDEVYIVGAEEGGFPKLRADSCEAEERRLFFVAITRARSWLFVSWAASRVTQWGVTEKREPSRFIAEFGEVGGAK